MRRARLAAVAALLAAATLAVAACSGGNDDSVAPTPAFDNLTAAPAASGGGAAGSAPVAPAAPGGLTGDATNGKALFASNGCVGCHSTGDNQIVGPGLKGVFERAANRVPGEDAITYIEQSIKDPGAYVVEGFADGLMPKNFSTILSDADIDDIVAYLATLK